MMNNAKETYEDFGTRLKESLKKKGKTQRWLAEKLEVSSKTINNYISGYSSPKAEEIVCICNLLDISSDYLLTGEDKCKRCQSNPILTEENRKKFNSQNLVSQKKIRDAVNLMVVVMTS